MTQNSGNAAAKLRQSERDRMREMLGIEVRGVPEVDPHKEQHGVPELEREGYDVERTGESSPGGSGSYELERKGREGKI